MEKQEALSWLKNFIGEVDSQDNRATAKPIQFLLQTKREYVAHDDYNWHTKEVWRHPIMEEESKETFQEVVDWLKGYGYEGDKLAEEIENIESFQMGHHWETEQAFFTESGVKKHLELNRHNLRDHRDYVVHAFRNPEMKELFDAIRAVIK